MKKRTRRQEEGGGKEGISDSFRPEQSYVRGMPQSAWETGARRRVTSFIFFSCDVCRQENPRNKTGDEGMGRRERCRKADAQENAERGQEQGRKETTQEEEENGIPATALLYQDKDLQNKLITGWRKERERNHKSKEKPKSGTTPQEILTQRSEGDTTGWPT